ncbi:MAG: hypothetical protein VYD90_10600 [Pseudomonadota bacterium]|nr:hypothetical protein [Pseudomonadota bacterium]
MDALGSLAEIGLRAAHSDETPREVDEVRKLSLRALVDASEHYTAISVSQARYDACMAQHYELAALADRMTGSAQAAPVDPLDRYEDMAAAIRALD